MEKVINSYELTGRIGLLRPNKSFFSGEEEVESLRKNFRPLLFTLYSYVPREYASMTTKEKERKNGICEMTNDSSILSRPLQDKIFFFFFFLFTIIKRRRLHIG